MSERERSERERGEGGREREADQIPVIEGDKYDRR